MNTVTAAEAEALHSTGAFTICVIPSDVYFASRSDPSIPLPCHETVLRPLLRSAFEAWAYELKPGSEAWVSGGDILARKAGKYQISLDGEPIKGHEQFWNSAGGKRGSILLLFNATEFPAAEILPHCERVFIVNNPSVAHSPAAMRYAKAATSRGTILAAMLSRTNGMQWLSLHGPSDLLTPLFAQAKFLTTGASANAPRPAPGVAR